MFCAWEPAEIKFFPIFSKLVLLSIFMQKFSRLKSNCLLRKVTRRLYDSLFRQRITYLFIFFAFPVRGKFPVLPMHAGDHGYVIGFGAGHTGTAILALQVLPPVIR